MASFAPVAPIHILKGLQDNGALGAYHLLLAHDVLAHQDAYHNVFANGVEGTFASTIIMDNSVVELKQAVTLDIILPAVKAVKANVIVLPDAYLDAQKTVIDCALALDEWTRPLNQLPFRWGYMMVPQGKTLEEFIWCAEQFASQGITWWGIPRNLVANIKTRRQAIEICRMLNPLRKIHLLGFSDDIIDDMLCAHQIGVDGIDSAVPIRMASLGQAMTMTAKLPPRGDWWKEATYVPLMHENVMTTRRWLKNRTH